MFAFVKRVCVGVGAEVLVKIDGAEVDPVKLWCLFARASEETNFLPPCKFPQIDKRGVQIRSEGWEKFPKINKWGDVY